MKIVNAMFSKGFGGIEQAFCDYAEMLATSGIEALCVINSKGKIASQIEELQNKYPNKILVKKIGVLGDWDLIAKAKIKKILKSENIAAAICHGGRAVKLLDKATKALKIPQIAVAHNYSFSKLLAADYIFAVSKNLQTEAIKKFLKPDKVFYIPNVVRIDENKAFEERKKPFVIGGMGRFKDIKGFDFLIRTLGELKKREVAFKAIIGGGGEEKEKLKKLVNFLNLENEVEFYGWVKDKDKFYSKIDLFALPSKNEAFGIVMLEAMAHKKPVVSTKALGPSEIGEDGLDCLLADFGDKKAFANNIERLIKDEDLCRDLTEKAFKKVKTNFAIEKVAENLKATLEKIAKKPN